ncbi:uncharacterized protein Dwil_GK27386 [Drosophila willistoni]|uniref:Uncharacterized protein n=1 Tax=Drosophila willistoni TaxID=7260 RepID=A0A0Q9X3N6_DROWI|nr:uncharacterized protein Dwil_GK27386 [Drosophila willistoni]
MKAAMNTVGIEIGQTNDSIDRSSIYIKLPTSLPGTPQLNQRRRGAIQVRYKKLSWNEEDQRDPRMRQFHYPDTQSKSMFIRNSPQTVAEAEVHHFFRKEATNTTTNNNNNNNNNEDYDPNDKYFISKADKNIRTHHQQQQQQQQQAEKLRRSTAAAATKSSRMFCEHCCAIIGRSNAATTTTSPPIVKVAISS